MGSCQKSSCSGVWWWPLSVPALLHTQSRFPLELEWAQDSLAVLSPQDISVCTSSSVVFLFHMQKLQWQHSEPMVGSQGPSLELSWLGPGQPWSVACVVFFFFPFCSESVNSPCPWQEVQGLSLLFLWGLCSLNVLAAREGIQNSPKPVMLSLNSVFHVSIPFPKLIFSWPIVKITSGKLQQVGVPCSVLRDWSVELC